MINPEQDRFGDPSTFVPSPDVTPTDPGEVAREAFFSAMNEYEAKVAELGIAQAALVGLKEGFRTGYVWNVLSEDFTPEQRSRDPRFSELDQAASNLIERSRAHMPLRVANLQPSRLGELQGRYAEVGFNLELQKIDPDSEIATTYKGDEPTEESVDTLIGGLEPADVRLQTAHVIAQRAILDFGDDPKDVEETMGLTLLDRIKDKKAAEMLKDVVVARNSAIEGGFARGFELLAEPTRVLQDIVENIYDFETARKITELDVRGAIEANALVCSFSSQGEYAEHSRKYVPSRE